MVATNSKTIVCNVKKIYLGVYLHQIANVWMDTMKIVQHIYVKVIFFKKNYIYICKFFIISKFLYLILECPVGCEKC